MFDAYAILSNQSAPHPSTESCAEKHANTNFSRPYSDSQLKAFDLAHHWATKQNRPIVLDSGCGTGESTFFFSKRFPECSIIGVDQSAHRLDKATKKLSSLNNHNIFFVRARLEDFWRLALDAQWRPHKHFILYPNPWPKAHHLPRRWHGHPVFPALLALSPNLELRSNWLLYLEEFALATKAITKMQALPERIALPEGISAFERKYRESHSPCYALRYGAT